MATKTTLNSGVGFSNLLTILFIGLKLAGFITWSWVWVLSPLWLPLAAVIVIGLVTLIVGFLYGIFFK